MAEELSLQVEKRAERGKGPASRLRRSGRIPGVLYGDSKDPVPLSLDPKGLDGILKTKSGVNSIFQLEMADTQQRRPAMIHALQRHPLSHKVIHADFMRINLAKKIEVKVHVELVGVADGVKNQGGILEFPHREVEIECLPAAIPDKIEVDVSRLALGDAIRVKDLAIDTTQIRVLDDPETLIVVISQPAAEEAASSAQAAEPGAAAAAAPAAAEPEKKAKE